MAPKKRDTELQTELNKLDAEKQAEFLRSTYLAKTIVEAEAVVKQAQGDAQAQRTKADANLYTAQQRALGIQATMNAQAEGIRTHLAVATPDLVKFYLSIENNLFEKMATKTAEAVQGMNPKINLWTTGKEGSGDVYKPLQQLFQSLPPMLDAVQSQTNVTLPSWMPQEAKN